MASTSTASPRRRAASPVGEVLKTWRRHRRMSQLDLSAATGVTPRHISFVETGRASPSRELLETLADALDMPLRDRNDLHLAAGFAPPYRELGLDDRELADTMMAIDRILDSHEPLPAVVMDRHWNLLRTNAGAVDLFATMLDLDRIETPANVLEMMFDPQLLRPHVLDWEELARPHCWSGPAERASGASPIRTWPTAWHVWRNRSPQPRLLRRPRPAR